MSITARRLSRHSTGGSQPSGQNILIGKVFSSDVAESSSEPGHAPGLITDQNYSTRWISQPVSPVAITADLQGIYSLSSVVIVFAADTIQNYTIAISSDGTSWSTMASGTTNNTTSQTITHTNLSGTTQGRYLRITGTSRWNSSYGNSIWEVEAYGTLVSTVPVGTISNFTATVASNTAINLSWAYSGSTLTNYTLRRNNTTIASPAAGATSYSDTGLTAGTTYSYSLTGNLQAGGTSNTATRSATTTGGVVGLPPKIVGAYWQMYQGPTVAEITSSAPEYNLQLAAFALGNGQGGSASFNPAFQSAASFKTDMHASQAAGCKWLISIGGGVPQAQQVFIRNQSEANQLVASLKTIVNDYGFDGIDFDLENGPSGWAPAYMTSVAEQLKSYYGQNFIVSIVPRPYETFYYDTAVMMGNNCDIVGLQFYDNQQTSDTTWLRNWIRTKIDEIVGRGIPPSKIVIGCITYYPEYGNGSNTVAVYRDAFLEAEAKYPDLRGVFIWESSLDKKKSWSFAKTMAAAVL